MRPHRFTAIATLAIAPVVNAAAVYDVLTYPLQYSGATVTLPGLTAGPGSVTGYQVASVTGTATGGVSNAVLFAALYATTKNLNPGTGYSSVAFGADLTQQVGNYVLGSQAGRAALWSGTAASMVSLNPTNFNSSNAVAVSGNEQVGTGYNGSSSVSQALLWTGTSASAIDLNSSASQNTYVAGTDGTHQVGGVATNNGNFAARLWTGNAASAVDLTPTNLSGLTASYAYGVFGSQQVGLAYIPQPSDPFMAADYYAVLWNGSGGSAVNLSPQVLVGISSSAALGTNGSVQVGYGYNYSAGSSRVNVALAWSGTAASVVNLGNALPTAGIWTNSVAESVDQYGTIAGTATGIARGFNGSYGVNWSPSASMVFHAVASGEIFQFAPSASNGIAARQIPGFGISSGGYAYVPASTTGNRQLLVIGGNGLQMTNTGQGLGLLDINNNDLDLPVNSASSALLWIGQGFSGGAWNGTGGITSTSAMADTTHLTAIGYMQNNQSGSALFIASHQFDGTTPGVKDVLLKYTYYGDANLDGKVDASDYSLIDSGFTTHSTGWSNGDFNYDSAVNGSDYTLIDNVFNRQGAAISTESGDPQAVVTSLIAAPVGSGVPEPTSVVVLVLGAASQLRRRQRVKQKAHGGVVGFEYLLCL